MTTVALIGCEAADPSDTGSVMRPSGAGQEADREIAVELLSRPPVVGGPFRVAVTETRLWVSDSQGDPGLHVLDRRSGELLTSMGRRGDGPSEFASYPTRLHRSRDGTDEGEDLIWALDGNGHRLLQFEGDDLRDSFRRLVTFSDPRVLRVSRLAQGEWVGVTASEERRFILFDDAGNEVRSIPGRFPGPVDAPITERMIAGSSGIEMCAHPEGRGWVLAYSPFGLVERYDSSGLLVGEAEIPYPTAPVFERDDDTGVLEFRERVTTYIDCAASSEYILLLYSGIPRTASVEARLSGRWIHVVDWEGTLVEVVSLAHPLTGIAWDPEEGELFGVSLADAGVYRATIGEISERRECRRGAAAGRVRGSAC